MVKSSLFAAAGFLILGAAAGPALAAAAAADANPEATVSEVQITAHRLDVALQAIEPSLGATSFSMGQQFINNLPGGANTQLNQVVLQAPGVTQDGFGQLHVRGDHGNIQYRLNNVIQAQFLPPIFTFFRLCNLHSEVSRRIATSPVEYAGRR